MIMLAELSRTHVAVSPGRHQTGAVDRSSSIHCMFHGTENVSLFRMWPERQELQGPDEAKHSTCSQSRTNGQIQTIDFISAGPWHSGVCKAENPARAQWYKTVLGCHNSVEEKKDSRE